MIPSMTFQQVVPIWMGASVFPFAVPADSKSMAVKGISEIVLSSIGLSMKRMTILEA